MTFRDVTSEELARLPIGERVAYVRGKLKLSQVGFAKLIGVSDRTVKRWESSFVAPTRDKAERIAVAADLDPVLFYPNDTMDPEPDPLLAELVDVKATLAEMNRQRTEFRAELARQLKAQTDLLRQLTEAGKELHGLIDDLREANAATLPPSRKRRPA